MNQFFVIPDRQVCPFREETKTVQVEVSQWTPVSQIYHVARQAQITNLVPSENLFYDSWTSTGMALFGCRQWRGKLPTISPHGYNRVIVPVNTIFQNEDDYLFPLKKFGDDGRLEQSVESPDNWHLELLYVEARTMDKLWNRVSNAERAWNEEWKLRNHPYIQMRNGDQTLRYGGYIDGRTVWYDILVPDSSQFTLGSARLDSVDDKRKWFPPGMREVTEIKTADRARTSFSS
jgi:hypothetical protein